MVISIGAAAFWIAVAAVMIASGYFTLRKESEKHQTLLRIIEKTGQLDEQQVRLLFPPAGPPAPLPPHWFQPPDPLAGQRALRVGSFLVLGVAAGLAVLFMVMVSFGTVSQHNDGIIGLGAAGLIACIAIGMFVGSRFATGPRQRDEQQ